MIWPADTVKAVRQMGAVCTITEESLRFDRNDVMTAARRKMWGAIREMAQTWAVDVDIADIRVEEVTPRSDYERAQHLHRFSGRWRPAVVRIEFGDGPGAGQQMNIPPGLLFKPIQGTEIEVDFNPFVSGLDELDKMLVPTRRLTYVFGGWNETRRVWVYTMEPDEV